VPTNKTLSFSPLITPFIDVWIGRGGLRKQALLLMEPKFGSGNNYPNAHPDTLFIRSRGHPCGAYICFVSFVGLGTN
jgi:hypothetical protein